MVAAISAASPATSVHVARELGALLLSRAVISSPRWRAHATAQLVSTLAHYNLPLDSLRTELREVGPVTCPPVLQPVLVALLETELARAAPRASVVSRVVDGLWRPDWVGSSIAAVSAALRAGQHGTICELPALVPDRALQRRLRQFAVRGVLARHGEHGNWGTFEADVSERGAEGAFPISLPLVVAVADAIIKRQEHVRIDDLERHVTRLAPHDRGPGGAHVARVLLHLAGQRVATIRVRALRDDSVRAAAGLLLVRSTLANVVNPCEHGADGSRSIATTNSASAHARIAIARDLVAAMPTGRYRQRAQLAIVHAMMRAGEPLRARRALARIVDPALQADVWRLRTTIAMRLRADEPSPIWPHGHLAKAEPIAPWLGEPALSPEQRARIMLGVILLRSGIGGGESCRRVAPRQLRPLMRVEAARAELLELFADIGLDPLTAIAALREGATLDQASTQLADPLIAELLVRRAATLVASGESLPTRYRDGALGHRPPTTSAARGRHPRLRRGDQINVNDNADAALVAELLAGPAEPCQPPQAECPPAVELRDALAERRSLDRALYDEGSTWNAPRRRGVIAAAAACLREAIDEPGAWDDALVACRARTLAFLGGNLAREALEGALAVTRAKPARAVAGPRHRGVTEIESSTPASHGTGGAGEAFEGTLASLAPVAVRDVAAGSLPVHAGVIFEALCWLDRDAAARLAIAHATAVSGLPWKPLLATAERYRGLAPGFTRTWVATQAAIANRLGGADRARSWLGQLVTVHGVPSQELLCWVAERGREGELPPAGRLLARAVGRCEELQRVWPADAARMVADDRVLLDTLRVVGSGAVFTRGRAWSHVEWTKLLRRAASEHSGVVDRATVVRCATRLKRTGQLSSLMAGDLIALGARGEHTIDRGLKLRVRLLGKRGDLMPYLRFADVPISNCFRSDSSLYETTQGHAITVWKDPLSLCFRIERVDGRPFGFVFGGFAELATGPLALVLNGLYLARQRFDARTEVLAAIEAMVCQPLGIRHVGIGNQFSGEGPLPFEYRRQKMMGTRLRALRKHGELVTDTWDDISDAVNVPSALDMWWRTL